MSYSIKEKEKEYQKKYRAEHKKESAEYRREYARTHRDEMRKYRYKYDKEHPGKRREQYENYKKNFPERIKHNSLKYYFGIGYDDWQKMLFQQNDKCAICGTDLNSKNTCVDHCHATKAVRGLLCTQCNFGLGHFKDSIFNLKQAMKYLRKYEEQKREENGEVK